LVKSRKVKARPNAIFVRGGRIHSSPGFTAGIVLALAMVEEDFGVTIAHEVAS
jgi:transcriptional regulator GlxA family with amidase domain